MELILNEDKFVNNTYTVTYGNREAVFTIIDEELNNGCRINRINILVKEFDDEGKALTAKFCTSVIGLGDGTVGVKTDEPNLRGKLLTHENMDRCIVELYE